MFPRTLLSVALLVLALAAPAYAAVSPPGVNIRWDNCYDDGGLSNKTFACDTNTGIEQLVLSFALDTPMADVSGTETRVEFWSASASLPPWWQFFNAGSCRLTGMTFNTVVAASATNCLDWSAGTSAGGVGSYSVGFSAPNMAMLRTATAVAASNLAALNPGQEYFFANLRLTHTKTVGTGACAGCDIPVCIVFSQLRITTPTFETNRTFIFGANGPASQLATWQNGLPVNPHVLNAGSTGGGPRMTMDACVVGSTPTQTSTWGRVKALYR
jgi:hypothetical protein